MSMGNISKGEELTSARTGDWPVLLNKPGNY